MFRKALFWMHLSCGVLAGVVILMMSVTGAVLTYERQLQVWEDRSYYTEVPTSSRALPVDQLLTAANRVEGFEATSIQVNSDGTAPAVVRMGRSQTLFLNPYSAEIYPPHSDSLSSFFSWIRTLHRWFTVSGEGRDTARDITGASNLMFLFLLLTGMYLWLPKIITRATLRIRVWFNPLNNSTAARDFNWHHMFGFWAAIPLLVIIPTATVFHYSWANALVYRLAGESPPVRGQSNDTPLPVLAPSENLLSFDELFTFAKGYSEDWKTITLALPEGNARHVVFTLDEGNGGEPHKRHSLSVDAVTGDAVTWAPFDSRSPGYKARRWVRFLHTGEALGLIGQTVAGLASIAGAVLVWTGLALALRRLLRWRQRRAVSALNVSAR